jgi:hypothetical protein
MTLIYKPIGLIIGLLSGLLARQIFNEIWGMFDEQEPPEPTTRQTYWPKLLLAAAMQGMILRVVRVFVDRGLAKGWAGLTGTWPGEQRPEQA